MLGWEYEDWYRHVSKREIEMKHRLKNEKILIILYDIWKEIHDFEKIGIPSCKDNGDGKRCKIVLTCRNGEELCKDMMGAQICFPMETLPPKEAWILFKNTSGADCDSVMEENNPELRSIATQIVEECEGLPQK